MLGIIDVFSRKGMIYKQSYKKYVNIIPNILEKEFFLDEGHEFKNVRMEENRKKKYFKSK